MPLPAAGAILPAVMTFMKSNPWMWFLVYDLFKGGLGAMPGFPMNRGDRGQLELGKGQLALQEAMFKAGQKGKELAYKRSKSDTKELLKQTKQLRREDRAEAREERAFHAMLKGRQETTAMMMSLINAMMQNKEMPRSSGNYAAASSLAGLLR